MKKGIAAIYLEVDQKMYRDFKIICIKKGISVKDAVEALMTKVVDDELYGDMKEIEKNEGQ